MAILLIIIFSVELNWLPAMGMQSTGGDSTGWEIVRHMTLPTVALSLIPMGVITRMVRASVLEILSQDFVLTLRAKGLWSRTVTRHVIKNAAPPVLTLMGLQFGYLLGGSVLVALLLGSTLGITAGFVGGRLNLVIMRGVDIFFAFPSILLAIAIWGALGAGLRNTIIALSIVFTPPIARVAESVTTQVRGWEFMEAARASGAGTFAIIQHHMIANVLAPIFVYASTLISVSVIIASGLSFLGLGVSPPNAEWGLMLNTLRGSIYVNPWVAALPGVMIFMTSMSFNLLSDGLRDAMDV